MWKNYLYFTKKEKTGIFILFVLIIVVFTLKFFIPAKEPENTGEIQAFEAESSGSTPGKEFRFPEQNSGTNYLSSRKPAYVLHVFDPNTADSLALVGLGLKPYLVKNIIKYRSKGGKFKRTEDFSKLYGLPSEKYEELKPYIRIDVPVENRIKNKNMNLTRQSEDFQTERILDRQNDQMSFQKQAVRYPQEEKYSQGIQVNVAIADTSELKKIPRIGSSFANRIVNYRQRLGGFYSVEQLKEVYGMTAELFEGIRPWLKIETNQLVQIDVNKASVERFKAHPYLNFYQAKAIVDLKRKKGKLQNIQELSLLEEFTENDLQRLKHYFSFE